MTARAPHTERSTINPTAPRVATTALALIVLLAGCAAPATSPSGSPTASAAASAAPTPAATPEVTASPTPTADPMADWQLIQAESGRTQFRIPADWSADVTFEQFDGEPFDGASVDGIVVRRPDGQPQLRFSQAPGDVGGTCTVEGSDGISTPAPPDGVLLDREPIALGADGSPEGEALAFAAVAAPLDDGRWLFGMGITGEERLQEPLGCPFYFIAGGPAAPGELGGLLTFGTQMQLAVEPDGELWVVDSLEAARAYLETEEYTMLQQILLSLEYRV